MQDILYRYRAIDKHTLEGLRNSEFYFTSPKDFNDPFDCKNQFSFEGSDDNDWRQFFKEQLKHQEPHLSSKERNEKVEAVIRSGTHRVKEIQKEQKKIWGRILEEDSNKIGIVCLSRRHKDILMWSHYSDKHRGVCLEFDKGILESRFYCRKVCYSQKYPTFNVYVSALVNSGPENIYKMFLLAKAKHWKYEKEYRLIVDPSKREDFPEERKFKYPEKALIGLIWGCQTSDKDKKMVMDALKANTHQITYYQAKKSESDYALDVEKEELL